MKEFDLIVIGAGPAGISAGLYAASRGKNVAVIEKNIVGGIVGKVSTVTHYSGLIEHESGETFAKRLESQARQAGVKLVFENVISVKLQSDVKVIMTDRDIYEAKAVIIANGSTPRKLDIPGESELAGHGIGLNAAQDGASYLGKNVYVVGGADGAIKEAIYLAQFANKLTVIHFEEKLGTIPEFLSKLNALENVELRMHTRLTAVSGINHVDTLELTDVNTGMKEEIHDDGCGVFIYAGATPNTDLYEELPLTDGYIPVDEKMETAIKGVYAAGDIRVKQVRQVATAVSDGAIAAINACVYLQTV